MSGEEGISTDIQLLNLRKDNRGHVNCDKGREDLVEKKTFSSDNWAGSLFLGQPAKNLTSSYWKQICFCFSVGLTFCPVLSGGAICWLTVTVILGIGKFSLLVLQDMWNIM